MELIDLKKELAGNSYPGRGIVIGRTQGGNHAVIAYFIMGRSENSRNRIFEEDINDGLRTKAFDESKLIDPSLVIYSPVRVLSNHTIVTNGDQTDTIYEFIDEGGTFEQALNTRTFEPDPPIFTPRISGMVTDNTDGSFSYKLSILKSNRGNGDSVLRFFYNYENPQNGEGHFIHTYECDGNPPESFFGEPKACKIDSNMERFSNTIWNALDEERKISLFVRYINLKNHTIKTKIINKYN